MTAHAWLYVGCYTAAARTGIRVFDASDPNGSIEPRADVADIDDASFLAASVDRRTLYAVSESVDEGSLVAYRLSPGDGTLARLDEVPSHGSAPCHVSVRGDHVHVANYVSGTLATYRVRTDGSFDRLVATQQHHGSGPHPRQEGPHAHCVVASPFDGSVYATDLGTDHIVRYAHRAGGTDDALHRVGETAMTPGSGPRHIAFHPGRRTAYVVCELDNTLVTLDIDDAGDMHPRARVTTLPHGCSVDSLAGGLAVHPAGHRIYVSNRGHDSIATFAIDHPDAPPTPLEHVPSGGRNPRHFAIHPTRRSLLVANQDDGTLVAFALGDDAIPRPTGVVADVSQPACLEFVEVDR